MLCCSTTIAALCHLIEACQLHGDITAFQNTKRLHLKYIELLYHYYCIKMITEFGRSNPPAEAVMYLP